MDNRFLGHIAERIAAKFTNNPELLQLLLKEFKLDSDVQDSIIEMASNGIDTDGIKDMVVEKLVDDIDTNDIKESVIENISQDVDSDSITDEIVETFLNHNFDSDEVCEVIASKVIRTSSIRQEILDKFANHLIENSPEFKGQVIEYVGDKIFNHLINNNFDMVKTEIHTVSEVNVNDINKALIGGNLNLSTSGIPIEEVDISKRGI